MMRGLAFGVAICAIWARVSLGVPSDMLQYVDCFDPAYDDFRPCPADSCVSAEIAAMDMGRQEYCFCRANHRGPMCASDLDMFDPTVVGWDPEFIYKIDPTMIRPDEGGDGGGDDGADPDWAAEDEDDLFAYFDEAAEDTRVRAKRAGEWSEFREGARFVYPVRNLLALYLVDSLDECLDICDFYNAHGNKLVKYDRCGAVQYHEEDVGFGVCETIGTKPIRSCEQWLEEEGESDGWTVAWLEPTTNRYGCN